MTLKIALCDDNINALDFLYSTLWNYQVATDINLIIDKYTNPKDLLTAYKEPGTYHIVLLDIEMPEMNGIKVAEIIRKLKDRQVIIVFISNYPQYMQESFAVHPFHYLQKPLKEHTIYELMHQILEEIQDSHILYSIISTDTSEQTININDVLYIEVMNGKTKELAFHFFEKTIVARGTLLHWEKELSEYNFYLCRRGILLNLQHVHYFDKNNIILNNGKSIPVSRTNLKKLKELYINRVVIFRNS